MTGRSVLVVEDEADIREMIGYNLSREGFRVTLASSGEEALTLAESGHFDAVLLDLMLPGKDGLSVCQELRRNPKTQSAAIIMITAKRDETDIVIGLKLGADEYITKPFSPKVLAARIEAVLRRSQRLEPTAESDGDVDAQLAVHDLLIHSGQHRVYRNGEPIELSRTEFRLLALLAGKPGWVYTRKKILDTLYGNKHAVSDRAVDVQIMGLRKKLGPSGDYIVTVHGVGYRFKE